MESVSFSVFIFLKCLVMIISPVGQPCLLAQRKTWYSGWLSTYLALPTPYTAITAGSNRHQ